MDLYFYSYRWRHIWRKYYAENKASCDKNIQNLLERLDDESISYGKKILKYNLNTSHFGLIKDMILSYVESKAASCKSLKSNYILGNNTHPEDYIQTYKNGFLYVEKDYLKYVSGKDFIDGGAYIGDSAMVLNELNPNSIHCFEPSKKNYEILKKTIGLNVPNGKIIANELALDKECRVISLKGSYVRTRISETETKNQVEVVSIDEYVKDKNLTVGLIKLDVESLEYNVVLGSKETIKKHKPVLLISIYHTLKDFLEIMPLIESFNSEYQFMIRPTHNYSLNLEFMLIGVPKIYDTSADAV